MREVAASMVLSLPSCPALLRFTAKANAVQSRRWQYRAAAIYARQVGSPEGDLHKIRSAEVGPAEVGPAEVGPAEVGPTEVGPTEVGLTEVCVAEICLSKVRSSKICLDEVRPNEVRPGKICPLELRLTEVWFEGGILCSVRVPNSYPLPEKIEMVSICHGVRPPFRACSVS